MKVGFSEDKGWWVVGARLFLMIIMGSVVGGVAANVLDPWFSRWLTAFLGSVIGMWLGDAIFHEARRRYLRRH